MSKTSMSKEFQNPNAESLRAAIDHMQSSAHKDINRVWRGGVTPLWTVFHLCNYFGLYLINFGISARFSAKKAKLEVGSGEDFNARAQRPMA